MVNGSKTDVSGRKMRLICPNCDAQYEVPDDVMPVAGRDVQCSNCGQTWFQHHPDHTPSEQSELIDAPAPDEETAPPPPPPPPAAAPERKQLDPAVADILRQEAEAEQAARRSSQPDALESQPDLGMDLEDSSYEDSADRRSREARDRMARLRGNDTPEVQAAGGSAPAGESAIATTALGSRRDLLPDIEEINSTLRSGSARTGVGAADLDPEIEAPTHQRKRRGFRTGFHHHVVDFCGASDCLCSSPRACLPLYRRLPHLCKAMSLQWIKGRSWLDAKVQSMLKSLDSAAAGSS